jgi:tetratricopeptide (TPR) repeat protein
MVTTLPWSALLGQRYRRLGVIGRGATGTVYRALDRLSGRRVALKNLSTTDEPAIGRRDAFESHSLLQTPELLEREFRLLAGLRHPNIIATLDFGRDDVVGPFFTMDLQDDSCTLRTAVVGQTLETKVELLVQLLHALAYLHRCGIVHRDLKPENALCSRGVLKLIDLGLAAPLGRLPDESEAAGGTLAYAAPELVRGAAPNERTDLYAVGVIAYELLTGRVPFDARSPAQLLQAVFQSTPDFELPGITPSFAPVLRRLLARDRQERFSDALEVIGALSNALGRPLTLETTSTRESFLQGAKFIGRDVQRAELRKSLPLDSGAAGARAVLVAGESGVGKSRLLEELAVEAALSGVQVLRGQALREGSRPYEPWHGVLRHLTMLAEPSKLEAAILASVVPDLSGVVDHTISEAPELDPEATQVRLVRVLEALVRRCRRPLLFILEDLQWAGTESLKLFARAHVLAADVPLCIIGSYRDDERPNLPRDLPGATTLTLGRFSACEISRLCASMLGDRSEHAKRVDLAELVHRRSEGNAFLALEVIRTLANEAGGLERVAALPLAERLALVNATEGLVHRRVERLSPTERALLQTAAIAGRELDLDTLKVIYRDLDVEECAARAVEAAVLASAQGRWWFAHDKLRDALIQALPATERRSIHRALAHAIHATHPARASTLAHHFGAAGDLVREKEFSAIAGDQFLRSGAYHEAIPFLRRALALSLPTDPPLGRAMIERRLGEALFRSGQLPEAREALGRALATLRRPLPASRPRLVFDLVREGAKQLGLRLRRGRVAHPRRRKPIGGKRRSARTPSSLAWGIISTTKSSSSSSR